MEELFYFEKNLDGLFVLSKTLNFLLPTKNVKLKYWPVVVRKETSKHVKSSRTLRTKFFYSVFLFECQDMNCSIIVTDDQDEKLSFNLISIWLNEAIDKTILSLRESETLQLYKQTVNEVGKKERFILLSDYELFCAKLRTQLFISLNVIKTSATTDCRFYFLATISGQSFDSNELFARMSKSIKWDNTTECILHLAYDVISASNLCLFWKREEIVDRLKCQPSYEYYPLGLSGVGNFYFNLYNRMKFSNEKIEVGLVKYYQSLYKYVHRKEILPFQESQMTSFIWKFLNEAFIDRTAKKKEILKKKCETYLETLKSMKNIIEGHQNEIVKNRARLEIIVSALEYTDCPFPEISSHTEKFIKRHDLLNHHHFLTIDSFVIACRTQKYLRAVINTLEPPLQNLRNFLLDDDQQIFQFSCRKCESILNCKQVTLNTLYVKLFLFYRKLF